MWHAGDTVTVRGADWRVLGATAFGGCTALDLACDEPTEVKTLLTPFDRPRTPMPAPWKMVSPRDWTRHVLSLAAASFPYGGLRFCPPSIRLLPYQLEPALAVLRHGATRVLIGDDVGLGKTVEASLIVREVAMADPLSRTLILTPSCLRGQWARELSALFELPSIAADSTWLQRASAELPGDVNPWSLPGIYIASTDFVKRPEALHGLEATKWNLLVVDEAHAATAHTHRLAAIRALAWRSDRVVLLTATPHTGDDGQYQALCGVGAFPESAPLVVFARSREDVALPSPGRQIVLVRSRSTPAEHRLQEALQRYVSKLSAGTAAGTNALLPIVLRKRALSSPFALAATLARRKALVAGQPLAPQQLPLPLDEDPLEDDGEGVGGEGWGDRAEEEGVLSGLEVLAANAIEDDGKMRALLRLLRRAGEPAVVFSEYRDTAAHIERRLRAAGFDVCVLHGGLSAPERAAAVAAFTSGDRVLVATDAASEGLNLQQRCRLVVHFDLPWSSSRLRQRCGRVDRIGQQRRVHEVAIVARDADQSLILGPLLKRVARSRPYVHDTAGREWERRMLDLIGAPAAVPRVESQSPSPPNTSRVFTDEARVEVERLEQQRRLEALVRNAAPVTRAVRPIARDRWRLVARGGLMVVVAWTLRSTTASLARGLSILHLHLHAAGAVSGRSRSRRALTAAIGEAEPVVARYIAGMANELWHQVAPVWTAAHREPARRREGMGRVKQSTARQLVQAGLFDRRALRARRAASVQAAAFDESSGPALVDEAVTKFEIAAALLGGRR